MLYVLISCLVLLLFLRFLYLGRNKKRFKIATTNFGNKNNEPMVIQKEKECLIIVTDPVGTMRTGESACVIAKEIIANQYAINIANISPADFLKKACFLAHRGISEQMNANSGGCSIALVYINKKQLSYASAGDIGIYLCDYELEQINRFDLYKHQLRGRVLERKISEEKLLSNRLRNELTAYLGHENLKKVNLNSEPIRLFRSDKLFIATKDVHEVITPLTLESIIFRKSLRRNKFERLEKAYHDLKQAKEKKPSTASAAMISHFK